MKTLIFDPFSGASGDMIIGSLIDLGARKDPVIKAMESAASVEVKVEKIQKNNINATRVKVKTKTEMVRSYREIVEHVKSLGLDPMIQKDALSIFEIIARAESKIHGVPIENLHFHELGQEDAIADVIGACTALNELGAREYNIYCTPVSIGRGYVEMTHGKFPIPAPATLEILKDSCLIWQGGPFEFELLTPTGAAILSHFVGEAGSFPLIKAENVGYGAGSFNLDIPNVLRTIIGEVEDTLIRDRIDVLETNVDDVSGEVLGNLIEELLAEGARDAAIIPATMKKGRPGHIIQVIAKPEDSSRLIHKVMQETGSLGVRVLPIKHRLIAQREMSSVKINIKGEEYEVQVKIGRDLRGEILDVSAEFEDCKKVAHSLGVPVRDIIRRAEEEGWKNSFTKR